MIYRQIRSVAIAPGDSVRVRPKRVAGPRVETSVAQLLKRDRADGLGFVDKAGDTYRQFYYDVEVFSSLAV